MVVPPVWMFMIAAAATVVVVSVGIIAYNEYQDRQRRKTAYGGTPKNATKRREPIITLKQGPHRPCEVCIDENATIQFLPCGHILLCRSCYQEYNLEEDRCPDMKCRSYIANIKRIS